MTPAQTQRTILVVDDESDMREILIAILSSSGYRPIPAVDGGEALRLFRSFAFDLILLDLMLPDMSGFDVCKRIKSESAGYVPVVFLTARGEPESLSHGLEEAGADDYIVKPFRREELLARIKACLRVRDLYEVIRGQNEMLGSLSVTDDLTGLFNRRYLTTMLSDRIEGLQKSSGRLCCAMLDLDRFKQVNDMCGHLVGDEILRKFAGLLKETTPNGGICGRWGGDEFMILFPDSFAANHEHKELQKWADDLVGCVEREKLGAGESALSGKSGGDHPEPIGVSGGVATIAGPDTRLDAVRLMFDLDALLYRAKNNGRSNIVISDDDALGRRPASPKPDGRRDDPIVFVLEDDPDICSIVRDMLARQNVESHIFQVTSDLMSAVERQVPQLILLDLKLADADGIDICRELKQRPTLARTKIVLLTAFTSEDVRVKAQEAGADGYILKPFSYAKFVEQVNALLARG